MEIGILSKTISRPTLEEELDCIRAHGIRCIQFSLTSTGLSYMPDEIPPSVRDNVRQTLATKGVTMSGISGTYNMAHPNPVVRQDGLRRLKVMIKACRDLGTSVITLCTGTRDPGNMWRRHTDNDTTEAWRDLCQSVSQALPAAEEKKVILAFEPEVSNIIDSARKGRQLIDEMQSDNLKVVMDGANIFHRGELATMHRVLDQAFDLLGNDIVLAHAKDLDQDGEAGNRPAGKGLLDYDHYIGLLRQLNYNGPLLLHGLKESEVAECVGFLQQKLVWKPASF